MWNNLLSAALSSISNTVISAGQSGNGNTSLTVSSPCNNSAKTSPNASRQISAKFVFPNAAAVKPAVSPYGSLKPSTGSGPKPTKKATLAVAPYTSAQKSTPRTKYGSKVDLSSLHSSQLVSGPVRRQAGATIKKSAVVKDVLYIKTLTGKVIEISYQKDSTALIGGLKKLVSQKEGIPADTQILKFGGKVLDDNKLAADYNIRRESTLHLTLRSQDGTFILALTSDQRSPRHDYDFTSIVDIVKYCRGGHPYVRPCGWKRFALNVLDRYENNKWLGVGRAKDCESMDEEWAVSYHGTGRHNLRSIAEDGFLLSKGMRFLFGHGIYTTPEIGVAELYASEFTIDGVTFKAVVQNRVNPETIKIVTKAETKGIGEYWITEKEKDIRPYGICIKKK